MEQGVEQAGRSIGWRLHTVVRLACAVLVTAIAALAVEGWLAVHLEAAWTLGAGFWPLAGGLGLLAALGLAAARRPGGVPEGPWALAAVVGLALGIRLLAVALIDAPVISDFLLYHNFAVELAQGGAWQPVSHDRGGAWWLEGRPMGYPSMLALAYALAGPSPAWGEALNVGLGVLGCFAMYAAVTPLAGARVGRLAALLFALWPAHVLMTPVLATEVAYATLVLAMAAALARARGTNPHDAWRLAAWAGLAGAATAAAQYVRPTTLALVPAALLALAWRQPGLRAAGIPVAAYGAVLLTLLLPVAFHQHAATGKWSLSTSGYGSWSLLVGMNQQATGMWNVADDAAAGRLGTLPAVEAWARVEGWRRLTADPAASAHLMVRKLPLMWRLEDFGTYWALGTRPGTPLGTQRLLTWLAQAFWAAVSLGAAWALWRRHLEHPGWLFWIVGLLTIAAVHALLEVQSRYHFAWTPLLIALAAVGWVGGHPAADRGPAPREPEPKTGA
jgi:hypothetical protein